ncbi:MAG: SpoVR family protein [Planctomycetota bacterium]|jgi:stage V sporulation protein R
MRLRSDLSPELKYHALIIETAAREAGLDFHDVTFELLDARNVNGVAAYGGFPTRYPSWRFGMDFERLQKGYDWGLSKIYELVINTDPVIAYLVRSNSLLEQKLVMAHVFGHADFFKHNVCFAGTDTGMLDTMGRHAATVRRIIDSEGQDRTEAFIDAALSLDGLIDPYRLRNQRAGVSGPRAALSDRSLRLIESMSDRPSSPELRREVDEGEALSGETPTLDVLGFLERHAPLEHWQREILRIVRAEAYYFAPQRLTKIANEGWACYWHSKLLTGGILEPEELIDYADVHSGATAAAPGQLNPYRLGLKLMRYAEERGEDMFLLRRIHSDVSLIDALVDEEFVLRYHGLTLADTRQARDQGLDWTAWKEKLLGELAWGGQPRIELIGVDRLGRGELELRHHHDGRDLQVSTASETLKNLATVWNGPVQLTSRVDDRLRRMTVADGEFEISDVEPESTDPEVGAGEDARATG